MIEALTGFPDDVAAFACHGHITQADYETVLIPDVEKRLTRHDNIRVYYEIADDFVGVDPAAIWEDTKIGLTHWFRWKRFAVVTDVDWIKHTMKLFGFLLPGELRAFPLAQTTTARDWITGDEKPIAEGDQP